MSLIQNERTELTSSGLNALSAASIAVGGLAQLAPLFVGAGTASVGHVAIFSSIWIALGIAIHVAVLGWPGKLRE